ncbi:hypothetical protein, partial [Haloferula sp. A504]|uniref:hypothetical protein n=1 Tax=Haloferula sp. A504 TaxID=3373601 RepID=UPI0031C7BFB5|nr:hypothetical protein [Verrucomicrobiaceae bacterium E54]
TMDLAAGTDTVNTNAAATVDGAGALTTNGVALSNVETLASTNGSLTNTAGDDTINLTGNEAGDTNGIGFTGINTLDAAGGSDTLNTNADTELTGTAGEALSNGVTVS